MQERVSAARTRSAVVSGATSLVVVVALQVLDQHRGRQRRWATGQAPGLHALAVVLVALGGLVVACFIARAWASGRAGADRRSPLLALSLRQQRQVRRQALGRQPCLPDDVLFLRLLARRWSRPDHVSGMAVGGVPLFSGLAILSRQPVRTLNLLLAAYLVVSVVVLLRRAALARAFLRSHPPLDDHARR